MTCGSRPRPPARTCCGGSGPASRCPWARSWPTAATCPSWPRPRKLARAGALPIIVRVVEYHLLAADGTPTEVFALLSTLLDPDTAPAAELAELYHARWQIENAFGAFKSQLKGNGVVLRSKTPDGAEQELWALLCAYHAIRELICAAADLTDQDPLRLSFVAALDAVRGPVGDPAAFPP